MLMDMTTTTYTTGYNFVEKVRDYVTGTLTNTWTNDAEETDKDWDTSVPYTGWEAGNGKYLQISRTHFTRAMTYRFFADPYGAPTMHRLWHSLIDPNDIAVNTNTATPAWEQNRLNSSPYFGFSMPHDATSRTLYFFTPNDATYEGSFICAVMKYSDTEYASMAWGLPILDTEFQTGYDYGQSFWHGGYSTTAAAGLWSSMDSNLNDHWWPWYSIQQYPGGVWNDLDLMYWNGQEGQVGTHYFQNLFIDNDWTWGVGDAVGGYFDKMNLAVRSVTFSDKRMAIKPVVFWKETGGGGTAYPVGTLPVYIIPFTGLSIAEQVSWGGNTYICFPNNTSTSDYGFAFRIA
jgi:hypothetical protein